jgi:hypothetical protein
MTATPHRKLDSFVITNECDQASDLPGITRPDDSGGSPVEATQKNSSGVVITGVAWKDARVCERLLESVDNAARAIGHIEYSLNPGNCRSVLHHHDDRTIPVVTSPKGIFWLIRRSRDITERRVDAAFRPFHERLTARLIPRNKALARPFFR